MIRKQLIGLCKIYNRDVKFYESIFETMNSVLRHYYTETSIINALKKTFMLGDEEARRLFNYWLCYVMPIFNARSDEMHEIMIEEEHIGEIPIGIWLNDIKVVSVREPSFDDLKKSWEDFMCLVNFCRAKKD